MKKPKYTEPMLGWNEENKKTGLVKFGVTHYEPPGAQLKKIACPIRPPVSGDLYYRSRLWRAQVRRVQRGRFELAAPWPCMVHVS